MGILRKIILLMLLTGIFSVGLGNAATYISRDSCMSIAASYYYATWTAVSGNGNSTYNYYTTGMITQGLPYNWGGWQTVSKVYSVLASGAVAGDGKIFSSTHSDFAGNDCSGYVSRCWITSTKNSTSTIPSISSTLNYADLYRGDVTDYAGSHVRLFDYFSSGTNYLMSFECTTGERPGRVTHRILARDNNYVPMRYKYITPFNPPTSVDDWCLYN